MSEHSRDTDEPGGTPSPGPENLTDGPVVPGARRNEPAAVPGEPGRMLLSIEVPDVDALLPKVEGLGGTATSEANDMPWGQRVAHIKDPDGNVVNLTQQL